jgi:imidazolonepropionase-like amidohydrolase
MRIKVARLWTKGMSEADGPFIIETDGPSITAVTKAPQDDTSPVDVSTDLTAVPGYIDCHEHIGIDPGDEHAQSIDDASRIILRGVRALTAMTRGGVTTIRDCGERVDVEPYWVEALKNGTIPGPRVIRSVTPICRTGGHAWYLGAQSDGVDQVRSAVRRNVRDGADFIKVMATGGFGTVGSSPTTPEYSSAEMSALVEEAHRLNKRVAAHAHGGEGVDQAIEAGVDSIEHGCLLTEKQMQLMVDHQTTLVVTMGVGLAFETEPAVPESIRQRMGAVNANYWQVLEQVHQAGVTVTLGSDGMHGSVADEMQYLVKAGFSPVEALTAGTATGAALVSRPELGELQGGFAADVVLVDGDPVTDIDAASRVRAVMAAGAWLLAPAS